MTEPAKDYAAIEAVNLLVHYGFDLNGNLAERLVEQWLRDYSSIWIRSAVIEALYQGRYKAISVEQILSLWQRRQQLMYHFNHEFERIVCSRFPKNLRLPPEPRLDPRLLPSADRPTVADRPIPFSKLAQPIQPSAALSKEPPVRAEIQPTSDSQPAAESPASLASSSAAKSDEEKSLSPAGQAVQSDSGIQVFQPYGETDLNSVELLHWSRKQVARHPIDQFIPESEASEFYDKLKAVARGDEENESSGLASVSEGE